MYSTLWNTHGTVIMVRMWVQHGDRTELYCGCINGSIESIDAIGLPERSCWNAGLWFAVDLNAATMARMAAQSRQVQVQVHSRGFLSAHASSEPGTNRQHADPTSASANHKSQFSRQRWGRRVRGRQHPLPANQRAHSDSGQNLGSPTDVSAPPIANWARLLHRTPDSQQTSSFFCEEKTPPATQ